MEFSYMINKYLTIGDKQTRFDFSLLKGYVKITM